MGIAALNPPYEPFASKHPRSLERGGESTTEHNVDLFSPVWTVGCAVRTDFRASFGTRSNRRCARRTLPDRPQRLLSSPLAKSLYQPLWCLRAQPLLTQPWSIALMEPLIQIPA